MSKCDKRARLVGRASRRPFLQMMETMERRMMLTAITWTGTTSSAWETQTNWNPQLIPGSGDDVTIPAGSTVAINSNATADNINELANASLTISSGSLTLGSDASTMAGSFTISAPLSVGSGGLTLSGQTFWQSGNIDLAGGNVTQGATLINTGTMTITVNGPLLQSSNGNGANLGGELDNQGTIDQPSGGYSVADSVTILNESIYDFTGDASLGIYNGNANITNTAAGTIEKTSGTGTSTVSLPLNNHGGKIEADTGTLSLANSGVSTGGTYNAATGASIDITGGQTPTWSGTYTGSGGGTVLLDSNALVIGAGGATFDFAAGLFDWAAGNINLAGSNVTTGNTLTNTGSLTITVNNSGALLQSVNYNGNFLGGELDNLGTILQPSGVYSIADNVVLKK